MFFLFVSWRLDNIVKEYSGATANIFTAVFCSFLFPEKFKVGNFLYFFNNAKQTRDDVVYNAHAPPLRITRV